jgi:hypothetical protein
LKTIILYLISFIIPWVAVRGQENWALKLEKNGIRVSTRKTREFKYSELRTECELEGSISQLAGVILDVGNHPNWSYKTLNAKMLKCTGDSDIFFYTEVESPWPFENRDFVAHLKISQNKKNRVMTIESINVNGMVPIRNKITRMRYAKMTWIVTPGQNGRTCQVDYRIQIDPGPSVPAWLLNLFATNGPYQSFIKLKEEIKLPKYAGKHYSFLQN